MPKLMKQMRLNTMRRWVAQRERLQLWIFLIVLLHLLTSCDHAPVFPTKTVWEVDVKNKVCGEYEIVDSANFVFKPVKDWPLEKCDGVFGFSAVDTPKVLNWGQAMQDYTKKYCGGK